MFNVCTSLDAGGAQQIAKSLMEGFAKRGYKSKLVFLYTRRATIPLDGDVSSMCSRRPDIVAMIAIIHRLRRMFRQHRPDAVIAHTPYSNVIVLSLAWFMRIPIRIAVQHSPAGAFPRMWCWFDGLIGSTSVYTRCIAVSESVKSSFQSHSKAYSKKIVVIPNGVENVSETITTAASPFVQNVPVLINVGRMSQSKRHSMLIDVIEHFPNAGLIIVGDGELRESVENLVRERGLENRVRFTGVLDHDAVWSYLKLAKVFVFTSCVEGLSLALALALAEAMSVGLPIVASDIPENREVLTTKDGRRGGILVESDNIDAYVSAIKTVLGDPVNTNPMSVVARQRASELDLNVMIDGYASCLAEAGKS